MFPLVIVWNKKNVVEGLVSNTHIFSFVLHLIKQYVYQYNDHMSSEQLWKRWHL